METLRRIAAETAAERQQKVGQAARSLAGLHLLSLCICSPVCALWLWGQNR